MKKYLLLGSALLLVGCGQVKNKELSQSTSEPTSTTMEQTTEVTQVMADKPQHIITEDSSHIKTIEKGIPAPELSLIDEEGKKVSLEDFKGKNVYINFWASWCEPCIDELEKLQALYQKYQNRDDFVFLSATSPNDAEFDNPMAVDGPKQEIIELAKKHGVTYPILYDYQGHTFNRYMIQAFPAHLLIDKEGKINQVLLGELPMDIIESELEKLINQ